MTPEYALTLTAVPGYFSESEFDSSSDTREDSEFGEQDLYDLLGVEQDASTDNIRAAYRRLAMRFHPDRNAGSAWHTEVFLRIGVAYATLMNPKKRAFYDHTGSLQFEETEINTKAVAKATSKLASVIESTCCNDQIPEHTLFTIDLVTIAKQGLENDLDSIEKSIKEAKQQLHRLTEIRKRFRRKTKKFDDTAVGSIVAGNIRRMTASVAFLKQDVRIMERAIKLIFKYRFDADEVPVRSSMFAPIVSVRPPAHLRNYSITTDDLKGY
jgi:hypothetical protein